MTETKKIRLNAFHKKAIAAKLKEHNILDIMYNENDERISKYCILNEYKGQIYCVQLDWEDSYYPYKSFPDLDICTQRISRIIGHNSNKVDKVLYMDTQYNGTNNRRQMDAIFGVLKEQLNNIYNTGAFDTSHRKYSSRQYNMELEILKLISAQIPKHEIYKKIMQDLFLSKEKIIQGVTNYLG